MSNQKNPDEEPDDTTETEDTILVISAPVGSRGSLTRKLKVEELSVNINLFLDQMGSVLEKTPHKLGKFQFVELEIHAEITAKGALAILGTGGEAGATGGVKFVFRKTEG
jgi:hypothetical protein